MVTQISQTPVSRGNGFPDIIRDSRALLDILRPIGDEFLKNQQAVVDGVKSPLYASYAHLLRMTTRGITFTQQEVEAYSAIRDRLTAQNMVGQFAIAADEGELQRDSQTYWTIDPIARLENYSEGRDDWFISIGFVKDRVPSGGVAYYPAQKQAFYTSEDGESYRIEFGENGRTGTFNLAAAGESLTVAAMTQYSRHSNGKDVFGKIALTAICRIEPFSEQAPQ